MNEQVRLQTRLPKATHSNLSEYAKQENISLNTAIVTLLDFALAYAKKGENTLLDATISDFQSNLKKVELIVDEFLINDAVDSYAQENKQFYLDYISEKFSELDFKDQKLLTDMVHALSNK
ncbi:hypothetical protein [Acinetobacter pittii]|uniref:hypothetical protein n=1 Tax=Acinetobacter pittii TaxID=48296 RepID=UPI0011A57973|nr:hypothetical protein [Acinetobacter pittii]